MNYRISKNKVVLELNDQEIHLIYTSLYANLQFVDEIDFSCVTGHNKLEARKMMEVLVNPLDMIKNIETKNLNQSSVLRFPAKTVKRKQNRKKFVHKEKEPEKQKP